MFRCLFNVCEICYKLIDAVQFKYSDSNQTATPSRNYEIITKMQTKLQTENYNN